MASNSVSWVIIMIEMKNLFLKGDLIKIGSRKSNTKTNVTNYKYINSTYVKHTK